MKRILAITFALASTTLSAQTTPTPPPVVPPPQMQPPVQPQPLMQPPQTQPPPVQPQPGLQPQPLPLPQPLGIVNQPPAPAPQVTAAETVETPNPLPLTIAGAIRMALSEGTQARLARTGEERARIARREALDAMLPQANANLIRYNQSINLATFGFTLPGVPQIVGPFNVTDAQVTAAMQLFNLAALRAYQSRTTGMNASRYDVERAENDVAAAVARLYVFVARAEAQVNARTADVKLFTELSRVANDEFKAGTGTRLDVAQANVQLSRAQQSLLSARNDRETARLALLNAIGADEGTDVILSDALNAPSNVPEVAAAIAAARDRRPDLKALDLQEKSAQLLVDAQRDRRLPSVSLDFAGDYSGNKSTDLLWSRRIAATASVPIFRGDINAAIARAKADLEDARTRHHAAEREVEQEVRSSLLTVQNANARVAVASENVKVAEEALQIARDRRAAGYGSPVEVDRAEDVYRQAHEDLIAAQADAAMSWYSLQHATGDIRSLFGEPAK
ncbi:MAG TPA: TolC family protein [Thermoanaerobaculia bacterium]|nr:TolC family protein [Thermoanaerobaculia bacterium]